MRYRTTAAAAGLVMLCVVPQAPAQPARDGATLEVLMGEVRALRMAIERQTALAARGQLLMGRLTLQEQRLLRARLELQSTEREIASAASELAQARAEQENAQLALENAEPAQRSHVEIGLRLVASRLRELQERATALEVRRSQATQALESERGRQEELERWVEQLERELIRNTP